MIYDDRIRFPDDDFRREYTGTLANGQVMHGAGHLTLKNGKTYKGIWTNGLHEGFIEDI